MSWDQIAQNWQQLITRMRHMWNDLSEEDLRNVNGDRDKLLSVLQERYGISRERAEKEVSTFTEETYW